MKSGDCIFLVGPHQPMAANYLEFGIWEFAVAPPQSGYSSTEIWIELEFGNVGF